MAAAVEVAIGVAVTARQGRKTNLTGTAAARSPPVPAINQKYQKITKKSRPKHIFIHQPINRKAGYL
ncbi:MAG: hypothetical protein FWB85_01100 [Chitinispirillia bacterium]|nr:hypothetical protein [Chitinispirillia bacterium]